MWAARPADVRGTGVVEGYGPVRMASQLRAPPAAPGDFARFQPPAYILSIVASQGTVTAGSRNQCVAVSGSAVEGRAACIARLLLIRKFETSARNGHPFRDIQGLGGRWPAPGELVRPSSDAVLASPEVAVSSPGLLPDRARNGHALTSGSI